MAYAILRFAKHKGGASKALSAHHERTKEIYASNSDIDKNRTMQNYHPQAADQFAAALGVHLRLQDEHLHPLLLVVVRHIRAVLLPLFIAP